MDNSQDDELDPMFAAGDPYAGKNSRLERSLRARRQLRDRKGRWIFMGGGLSSIFRMPDGSLVSTIGRSVGASQKPDYAQLMVADSSNGVDAGVYDVPAGNTEVSQAILPGSESTVPYKGSATSADIIDFNTLTRRDAPDGWVMNEDGSFTTQDGEFTAAPTQDGKFSLSQNDENIGEFRDAATAITRATAIDAESTADEETKKRVATLRSENADQEQIDRVLFNDPELAPQGDTTGQEEPNTVDSIKRRMDRIENEIQRRMDRGEDTADLEQESNKLEKKLQDLIDSGEQDGRKQAELPAEPDTSGSDGGGKGTVPDQLVGDDAGSPRVERRGDSLYDSNGDVVATQVSEPINAQEIRERGFGVAELFEVKPEQAGLFRAALVAAMKDHPQGASVTIHDEDYYKQPGVRMFLTQDGKGGIALNGDEIVSGFMARDAVDSNSGAVLSMVDKMVELGGRRLDAFDTKLPYFYSRAGFKPVARLKWNDEYIPTVENGAARDWNKEDYANYNNGEPDVVFMAYDPERRWSEYTPGEGDYVDTYEEGMAAQEAAVKPQTEEVVRADLTARQKAAIALRDAMQKTNDKLLGGDGLLEGEVPQNARGGISNVSLQLSPIGQVVEATSRNGRKRRFIKVGKDVWKRADKPDDKKRYRSYHLRGGKASFVPKTENDVASEDIARLPASRRRARQIAPRLRTNIPESGTSPEAYTPAENTGAGTTDDPQKIANIFGSAALKRAYTRALAENNDTVRASFPGQNGAPSVLANVPVDAIRDALQLQGIDTNTLAERVNAPSAEAPAEGAQRVVPEWNVGDQVNRGAELGRLYQTIEELDARYSLAVANGSTREELAKIIDTRAGILRRIRRLESEGFRNTYEVQNVDLSNFQWDGNTPDIYNPDLVMEALQKKYPDAEVLPNGDLKIGENIVTDVNGNRFKYEAIITKTDDEMFYTYIRETNLAEPDLAKAVRSMRFGEMRQSARATNNQAVKALEKIYNTARGSNVNSWFNDRRRIREGNPPRLDVLDENGVPTHVKDQVFTREAVRKIQEAVSDDQITEEMIATLYNYIKNFGNGEEVAATLYESFGLDMPTMNRFIDAVNENIADRDNLRRFSKWESDNGIPLAEGDLVEYTGEAGQTGNANLSGRKGIVKIRNLEHTSNGYTYTDYAYIQLLDESGRPTNEEYVLVSSHNLHLISTAGGTDGTERIAPNGVNVPPPAMTRRAVNRYAGRGRLRSVSPYTAEYNRDTLASPTVTIDGVSYPVQLSRASIIGGNFEGVSVTPADLQVGDLIKTFENIDGYPTARLNEVVGITEGENGSRIVHTVMPINISSGRVASTEYTPDMGVQLQVYRPIEQATPEAGATGLNENQIARLAEAARGVDMNGLDPELRARVVQIVSSTEDPAKLPFTQRQFADTLMELMRARDNNVAGTVSVEEASRVMENMVRYGEPAPGVASAVDAVRRWAAQRSAAINRSRGNTRPSAPRRAANRNVSRNNMNMDNLQRGPFTNNEGASSIGAAAFREALANGDSEVITNEIKSYVGGKVFGSKFALDNVNVSVERGRVSWSANIVDPATGRIAGTTSRYYYLEDGKLIVKHSSIFINSNADKGTGFATEYKKVSDNFYKSIGVDKIKIQTVQDGSYAWGKANYTWAAESDARSVRYQVESRYQRALNQGDTENAQILKNMLDRFEKPFNDADFPDPIDIANLQKSDGTPWGREIMTNSGWFGVRYLNPSLDPRPENRQNKGKTEAPAETPAEAPAEAPGSQFVNESGQVINPDWVDSAPEGSIVTLMDPSGRSLVITKRDGAWIESSYGSNSRELNPGDAISEGTMRELISRSITNGTAVSTPVSAEDKKKLEDYLAGTLKASDISPEAFSNAFNNADKAALDAIIIDGLFGNGQRQFGNFFVTNPVTTMSKYITTGTPRYIVEAEIRDKDGKIAGEISRTFRTDDNGNLFVVHSLMKFYRKEDKNSGFGKEFSAASEELYNKLGLSHILTDTAWDGSYVWGRAGYGFNFQNYSKESAIGRLPITLEQARQNALTAGRMKDAAALQDILDRFKLEPTDPNFPTPFEISSLKSESPDKPTWARELMSFTDWHGFKPLGAYGKTGEQYAADKQAQQADTSLEDWEGSNEWAILEDIANGLYTAESDNLGDEQ